MSLIMIMMIERRRGWFVYPQFQDHDKFLTSSSKTIDPEDIGTVSVHSPNHANYYPGSSMIHLDLTFNRRTGQVLGGQAVGNQGVDKRIDVISSYIHMKGTVTDLVQAELCYSPPVGSHSVFYI